MGCASHKFDLLSKDIMKLENFKFVNEWITKIINYLTKHHLELAHVETIQNEKYGNDKKALKLPGQTRQGGYVMMMESFLCNREALQATFTLTDLDFNIEIKKHVLTEDLWIMTTVYHNILKYVHIATTKLESEKSVLSEVPQIFEYVKENVSNALRTCEAVSVEEEIYILEAIKKRRYLIEKPIHFAANILDPRYSGLKLSPEKVALGQEFIYQYTESQNKNTRKVMANLAEYRSRSGFFSQAGIWAAVEHVEPKTWWKGLCDCQIISSIRRLSLGNNLTHLKDKITTDQLQKLITVRANIRLLSNPNENVFMEHEEEHCDNSSSAEDENDQKIGENEQDV